MVSFELQVPWNGFDVPLQHLDETSVLHLMGTALPLRYALRFTSHRLVSTLHKYNKDSTTANLSERDVDEREERD